MSPRKAGATAVAARAAAGKTAGKEDWLAANDDFLADRLAWLRERLRALARGEPMDAGPGPVPARLAGLPALPLEQLARDFNLTPFEANVVFLCVAMELDTGLGALCAAAVHETAVNHPSFGLAMAVFDDPAWEAMAPDRPLRHWQLVCVEAGGPLTAARLSADERITHHLKGLAHLDGRLGGLVLEAAAAGALPPSQAATAEKISALAQGALAVHVFSLPGAPHTGKERISAHVAAGFGLRLFTLDAAELPPAGGRAGLARLWHRETVLSGVALFLDASGTDPGDPGADAVRRWVAQSGGLMFVAVRESWPRLAAAAIDSAKPTAAEQRQAWGAALGAGQQETAALLAGRFDLDLDAIAAAAASGAGQAAGAWAAALEASRPALDQLAQRIEPTASLAEVVLPAAETQLLHRIVGQVRNRGTVFDDFGFGERMNRGTGLGVLFAGESGTGKTMAAEALARELDMALYKIDLSAVVSKYIGETEKNLRKLFDAAEGGGAVLFFDEADALFGKRSEVRDSHDRYANIEVSYLLQRMEQFRGLAILATNRKDSLDTAFLRRLRFVVNFPFPAKTERQVMWAGAFPGTAPVGALSTERLARLNLTGGSIHNVALNAAFLAANDGGKVTMELVLAAARDEFRKLDRPVNDADFAWTAGEERHGR